MPALFLLSTHSQNKALDSLKEKLFREGINFEILEHPKTALKKVKEVFHLGPKKPDLKPIRIAGYFLNPQNFTLCKDGFCIKLRKKEFELLHFLVSNRNRVMNRNTILENVWGPSSNPFTNTVDVHMASLRRKVNKKNLEILKTVHGVGYKFEI